MICDRSEVLLYLNLGASATAGELALVQLMHPIAERLIKSFLGYDPEQGTRTQYLPANRGTGTRDGDLVDFDVSGNLAVAQDSMAWGNRRDITLQYLPVRSITSIHENANAWATAGGDFSSSFLLTEGTHFEPNWDEPGICRDGVIRKRVGAWSAVPRSIKVVYVAGWSATELRDSVPEFKGAVMFSVTKWFNEQKSQANRITGGGGAITSESLSGSYSVSYDGATIQANQGLQYDLPAGAKRMIEHHKTYANIF